MPVASTFLNDFRALPSTRTSPASNAQAKSRGLLGRIHDAIVASNQRKAEREIAEYIARNGGLLTDRLESDIVQHFGRGGFGR
jgi:hypothetical protein